MDSRKPFFNKGFELVNRRARVSRKRSTVGSMLLCH
jgi:hypothetical protein